MGIERLLQHQPRAVLTNTVEALDRQRIYDQRAMQDNLTRIFDVLATVPFLSGTLVEDITIDSNEALIEHGLNKEVTGWLVVRKNGLGDIYDTMDSTSADITKYLPLKSSVPVIVSIWVW